MNYQIIAKNILALKNADLELRSGLIEKSQLGDGYNQEMQNLHTKNTAILSIIIDSIGYPTIDKVGKEAHDAAWLIIQHSIGQPSFMRKCARLLEKAVRENKANPLNLAYLSDRIAVLQNEKQLYGTQYDWDKHGLISPQPYDDLSKVNKRRESIGLISLDEQTEVMRKQMIKENQTAPVDLIKRQKIYEDWKKKVGWRK